MTPPPDSAAPPEQSGPVVVYGATGYTGKLVAAELARRGADFVIAGRSREKLDAVAATLGGSVPVAAVPLDDGAGLRSLLEGAAAVIACAGPFVIHGEPVVSAAAETGTHYVDTTGEQPFMRSVFERWGAVAEPTDHEYYPILASDQPAQLPDAPAEKGPQGPKVEADGTISSTAEEIGPNDPV